jgi:hypothetical protein
MPVICCSIFPSIFRMRMPYQESNASWADNSTLKRKGYAANPGG